MAVQDLATPTAQPGEVLLAVDALGICGSDLSGYLGHNSLRVPPLVMGHEFIGTIAALGPDETRLASGEVATVGQRVVVNPLIACGVCDLCRAGRPNLCRKRQVVGINRQGGFADYVAIPAYLCHAVPDGLAPSTAALTEPLSCGLRAVAQTHIGPGDTLLILGAGSIGLLCLVGARAAGVETIVITDTSPDRLQVAESLGATATLRVELVDLLDEIRNLTKGSGVTATIDAVGLAATREQAVRAVRPGGRAVFMGLHHETSELAANYVVRQEVEVTGAFACLPEEFSQALALLAGGAIPNAATWISERTFAAGSGAFAELAAGGTAAVKIALRPEAAFRESV